VNLGHRSASHPPVPRARAASSPEAPTSNTLQACEREHIVRVCTATGWKIKGEDGAAQRLGLNPGTLYSRMKKLGIRRP